MTPPIRRATPDDVLASMCDYFHIPGDWLLGKSRAMDRPVARGLMWLLIREHTPLSYPEIARLWDGQWSHSTVLESVQRTYRAIEEGRWIRVRDTNTRIATTKRKLDLDIRDRCSQSLKVWEKEVKAA